MAYTKWNSVQSLDTAQPIRSNLQSATKVLIRRHVSPAGNRHPIPSDPLPVLIRYSLARKPNHNNLTLTLTLN